MKNTFTCTIVFFTFIALFTSCHYMDKTGTEPSYLRINPFVLTTAQGQGSASQKIVDAWVYVDQESIGIFELPATIPILKAGNHLLEIKPGVLNSGSSQARIQYPFYDEYKNSSFTLSQNSLTTVNPTTVYNSQTFFYYVEGFESGVSLARADPRQAQINRDTSKANSFEGVAVGTALLNDSINVLECRTIQTFKLPFLKPVFIELNYNTNNSFQIGLVANLAGGISQEETISTFLPTGNTWKKAYVDASELVYKYSSAKDFNIVIATVKDPSISNAALHFDNIKLISIP